MANMQFPPGNWNQTVNALTDTIVLDYTSSWPGVNLTLFCETVQGTGDWIWWNLNGPLPANASYNLHLDLFNFADYINIFPTACHFLLTNSKDAKQKNNGGWLPLTTIKNKAETTWAMSSTKTSAGATTTRSDLSSPTAVSSGTSTVSAGIPTSTSTPDTSAGLSSAARIGVGVGAGLGCAILLTLAVLAILMYRRRRRARVAQAVQPEDNTKFEKPELLGTPLMSQQYNEMPAPLVSLQSKQAGSGGDYDTSGRSSPWAPPQELSAAVHGSPWQLYGRQPGRRYELGS